MGKAWFNYYYPSLQVNAKQSRKILSSNIFHWTASSDFILPRRDVCSQSFIAGLHPAYNAKKENWLSNQFSFFLKLDVGNELSSQAVARQVFLPLRIFTTVFGMGTGGFFSLGHQQTFVCCLPIILGFQLVRWKLHKIHSSIYNFFRKSPRPISNTRLKMLPLLHLCPINVVIYNGTY